MNSDVLIRLERFIATLKQEELEKQANTCADNKWVIKRYEMYFFYDICQGATEGKHTEHEFDIYRRDNGNLFLSRRQADDYGKWLKTDTKVRRFARDYNGDCERGDILHEIYYDKHHCKIGDEYHIADFVIKYHGNIILFKDGKYLEDIILKVGYEDLKSWLTYQKPVYDLE